MTWRPSLATKHKSSNDLLISYLLFLLSKHVDDLLLLPHLGTDDKIDKEAAKLLQVLKREVSSVVPPARALTYNVEGKQVAKTLEGIDQVNRREERMERG